jgi:hypothetical protein
MIMVVRGRTEPVRIALREQPRTGILRVLSETSAAVVSIDGHDAGPAPFSGSVNEGRHVVRIAAPGHGSAEVEVDIAADGDHLESLNLRRRVHLAWFIISAALAGAGLLTFAGLGAAALVGSSQYDPLAPDARTVREDGQALVLGADVTLGAACGLAAVALVLSFFTDWGPRASTRLGAR